MPIYLCQPGLSTKEPWRHGIQVYARPFPAADPLSSSSASRQQQRHQQQRQQSGAAATAAATIPTTADDEDVDVDAPEQIVVLLAGAAGRCINHQGEASNTSPPANYNYNSNNNDDSNGNDNNNHGGNGTATTTTTGNDGTLLLLDEKSSSRNSSGSSSNERRLTFILSLLRRYLDEHLLPPSTTTTTTSSSSFNNYNSEEAGRVLIFCPPLTAARAVVDNNNNNEEEEEISYCEWITRSLVQDGYRAISLREKDTSTATITSSAHFAATATATAAAAAAAGNDNGGEVENKNPRIHDWEFVVGEFVSGRSNVLVVDGGGTMAVEDAIEPGEAEKFIRERILASSTIMDKHFSSDDDDTDSTAPGIGAGAGGLSIVRRRRRDTQRRQEQLQQSHPKVNIAMVINLDLTNIDIRLYIARLNYTKKVIISLFDPSPLLANNNNNNNNNNEDNTATTRPLLSAKDMVEVLRTYRQKIPGELLTFAPLPPLISPSRRLRHRRRHCGLGDALAVVGGGDGGERGGYSENGNEEGEDDYADGDSDGDYEDGARMRSTVSSLRRQQYLNIRNTMVRSHSSSGDDNDNGNDNFSEKSIILQSSSSRVPLSEGSHLSSPSQLTRHNPVRRLRHAEVVLVDQCLTAYGKTWLRLCWPGELGGFAGFVAVGRGGRIDDVGDSARKSNTSPLAPGEGEKVCRQETIDSPAPLLTAAAMTTESSITASAMARQLPPETSSLSCPETNVCYPTSSAMKLLPLYDDGLSANQIGEDEAALLGTLVMDNGEPVFCRICREGLHDVDYGFETVTPSSATPQKSGVSEAGVAAVDQTVVVSPTMASSAVTSGATKDTRFSASILERGEQRSVTALSSSAFPSQQPTSHHHLVNLPPLVLHHPTAENPLLAPCDCTGSMAFVHYLCVEQWRCRSRHPGARNGLNCETCGAEYTLPPPPSRPASHHDTMNGGVMAEDDWLDAMPPHVLAALRRPHPAWQLGAAVVRRRWLRPVVPILVSPLVALYCRARRTLKKRGVSRRRWACSLCRRRARWKCVRCLRSYYCSRQCQNVSWHIVHKHVCYKPVRFWWSVVVYTLATFMLVPRLLQNFPVYDAMVTVLPINFIALGIVGGGIASCIKRSLGIDIRGRILEIIVVVMTLLLTLISSGLVRGYFGDASQCWGALSSLLSRSTERRIGPFHLPLLNILLIDIPLRGVQKWYLKWDFVLSKFGFVSRRFICASTPDGNTDYIAVGCSPSTHSINPQFYLEDKCSADMSLVVNVWIAAIGVLLMRNVSRQLRGLRRNNVVVAAAAGQRRPHQD